MPNYLIAFNDEWVQPHTRDELLAKSAAGRIVSADMVAAGVLVFSDGGLDASSIVCHVTADDGEPVFTDGPYTETKEHLGGFAIIDVPDDDTARYWAGRMAVALDWPQQVVRFPTFEQILDERN